ncbi:helix-turn-helix domain-containing protein [Bauldia litoralis]|uniref:helix-turn-helix domain-containing protein n=1 Tax=Bauldia litoralis TaxID=665467 RepID=UPI003267B05D
MDNARLEIGTEIRAWRQRRRMSQLDLALDTEVSARHLSFLETGRSRPSRDLVLRLAERLQVPIRERNRLLVSAGFAPVFSERSLSDEAFAAARRAIDRLLTAQEPYPALAVDRHWTLLQANAAIAPLLAGVAPSLLEAPANVLRISLHPDGLAPRIVNLADWRAHVLERLHRQVAATADSGLAELLEELAAYPSPRARQPTVVTMADEIAVPLMIETEAGTLSFLTTTTIFGTPIDVTLSEIAIESFFPADPGTAEALRRLQSG